MSTIRDQMLQAQELIHQKRYDEARAILEQIDHPKAHQWLARLNEVAPPASQPGQRPRRQQAAPTVAPNPAGAEKRRRRRRRRRLPLLLLSIILLFALVTAAYLALGLNEDDSDDDTPAGTVDTGDESGDMTGDVATTATAAADMAATAAAEVGDMTGDMATTATAAADMAATAAAEASDTAGDMADTGDESGDMAGDMADMGAHLQFVNDDALFTVDLPAGWICDCEGNTGSLLSAASGGDQVNITLLAEDGTEPNYYFDVPLADVLTAQLRDDQVIQSQDMIDAGEREVLVAKVHETDNPEDVATRYLVKDSDGHTIQLEIPASVDDPDALDDAVLAIASTIEGEVGEPVSAFTE